MPKRDINAGFLRPDMQNTRHTAASATNVLLTGSGLIQMDRQPNVPNVDIPLEKIKLRAVNRFHTVNNIELDESIRMYGLINPIAVCHHEGEDEYTISAGERRYQSVKRLHERYPDNPRFQTIECKVYILTEDKNLLAAGLPYITPEMEEGIYRDSNTMSRQLTDKDIASQIRSIVARFDDESYVENLRETAKLSGFQTYSSPDPYVLISSVIASSDLWSREKVRQYLIIRKSGHEYMLDQIEEGTLSVSAAYKQVLVEQKHTRKRKVDHVKPLMRSVTNLYKYLDEEKELTAYEKKELKECIEQLQKLL